MQSKANCSINASSTFGYTSVDTEKYPINNESQTIALDSLKIRIPLSEVTILDQIVFGTKVIVDKETGQEESEYKKNRHTIITTGITTSYGIERQITADQKMVDYLVVLFNSKLLKRDYFKGINLSNIRLVYDSIIAHKIVSFSYDSFLNGSVTDCDYKLDLIQPNFEDALKGIHRFSKPSKKVNQGVNSFSPTKRNKSRGIEFGKRNTATPSYPYLKFYDKPMELMNNSIEFYSTFLTGFNISSIVRTEFTIKNKKHFKKYGILDNSLKSILSLTQDKLKQVLNSIVSVHLSKRVITHKTEEKMSPTQRIIFNSINGFLAFNIPYNSIRESLIKGIDNKVARMRKRKELDRVYDQYIKGSELEVKNENLQEFYEYIGWY